MKAFVTGGGGFIGSHLVDHIVAEGSSVTVYDNFSSGRRNFLAQHKGNINVNIIEGDLLDFQTLRKEVAGHEIVFHFAANPDARMGNYDTSLDLKLETMATYNVLESMRLEAIKSIVFASSGTIYGETPIKPIPEEYGPVLPISLYGAGKVASEALISAFCNIFGIQGWIFRFANIVGNRATHGVIFDFINKLNANPRELEILGDGTQCKPYLHVENCVDGIMYCLHNSHESLNLFNLGCDTATTVNTIAEILIEEMGLKNVILKYTGGDRGWPGDVPQVRFNVDKIAKLGWKTEYTSDQALRRAMRDILGKE